MTLKDLYQEVILDHNKNPRNFKEIKGKKQEGFNPICGDHLFVYLNVKDDKIAEISFTGDGCAISKASASMMTQSLTGKTVKEAKELFKEFHDLVTEQKEGDLDLSKSNLGKLKIFSGIKNYPARIKCASLAWHTMKACLDNKEESIKTE